MTRPYPVDHPSRVSEIRRAASIVAEAEGLSVALIANAALVATEICTNLLKHAKEGEVFISTLSGHSEPGVEILAVDRGPGMTNVEHCLADGYSSANTSGTGLGAIARSSSTFDIYSDIRKGTVLVARIQRTPSSNTSVGGVLKPLTGEDVSGDAWAVCELEHTFGLVVADGLGHGQLAARASAEALAAYRRSPDCSPRAVLERIHLSLRGTRGAAVAVAFVDRRTLSVRYAGIGNIFGAMVSAGKPIVMISHNGTAGYQSPRFQEFTYQLPEEGLLIMHSDGLQNSWNLNDYPGLRSHHPSLAAGVLYRDSKRERDDACVVVAKVQRA